MIQNASDRISQFRIISIYFGIIKKGYQRKISQKKNDLNDQNYKQKNTFIKKTSNKT